jgi:hypothetical protein
VRLVLRLCAATLLSAVAMVGLTGAPAHAEAAAPVPHPHRKPWPITVTVQTVPPLAGVRLEFDGTILTTDGAGRAYYTRQHNFAAHTLSLVTTSLDLPDRHYTFTRWAGQRDPDQAFRPTLTGLPMRQNYTVTAAFAVQYPVSAAFVDQGGHPLDLTRVSSVTLRSDSGELLTLPTSGPVWLAGQVPEYRDSTMVGNDVSYSLQSIMMNGTNIVDAGRQRFTPASATAVTFIGQLHTLTIDAADAVYRGRVGDSAVVTYPDGNARTVAFGPDHTATLTNLPRGTYTVSVQGAHGIVMRQQVGLSKDRALTVGVLTVRDVQTIVAVGGVLAASMLLIGRLRRRTAALLGRGLTRLRSRRWREVVPR